MGEQFPVMAAGRLVFGIGAETLVVATLVALAQWFTGHYFALLLAINLSLARFGSYLADRSTSFASGLYERGWQPPMWLAVGFAVLSVAGALLYFVLDRRESARGTLALPPPPERFQWSHLLRFPASYWLLVGTCVSFYSVIFPFRSTFAIKYLQEARGFTLEQAGTLNSYVFLMTVFATPVFGLLLDRVGRNALLLAAGSVLLPLSFVVLGLLPEGAGLSTALLGLSFSFLPAVLWPTRAALRGAGSARHGLRPDDGDAERGPLRRQHRRRAPQRHQRGKREQSGRLHADAVVLRDPELRGVPVYRRAVDERSAPTGAGARLSRRAAPSAATAR